MTVASPFLFRLVREASGLSQEAFAARFGLKQAIWSKYETGSATPPEATLAQIAGKTGYLPAFFASPAPETPVGLVFHRRRSALPAPQRARIEAEARLRALDAVRLCRRAGVSSDLPTRGERTPEELARAVRERWGLPPGPVESLVGELDRHGVPVLAFDFKTDLLDGFFLDSGGEGVVCLALDDNAAFAADRRTFTLAHELGHALLHRECFPGREAEEEANRFAAELLMPEADIRGDLAKTYDFDELKRLKAKWRVSMAGLLRRTHALGVFSDSRYREYCIFLSKMGIRKQEPTCGLEARPPRLVGDLLRRLSAEGGVSPAAFLMLSDSLFRDRYGAVAGIAGGGAVLDTGEGRE